MSSSVDIYILILSSETTGLNGTKLGTQNERQNILHHRNSSKIQFIFLLIE